KTPAQWLDELNAFMHKEGRYPRDYSKKTNLTKEQKQERALYRGVANAISRGDKSDPIIIELDEIRQANLLIAPDKTPVQWLEELRAFMHKEGRYPRKYAGQTNLTKEQKQERALNVGVRMAILNAKKSDRMDSTIEKLEEIQQANLLIAGRKTPAQWLDELDLFIKQNKRFPIRYLNPKTDAQKRELALYRGVHHAVYNAKPTDSDERKAAVERMKNLWDLREAAQRGDITWDEALGKLVVKHKRPRINKQDSAETIAKRETEQKAYEQQLQAQADEITKEVSPAVMKGVYEDLIDVSKQDKRLLEAFPSWLQKTYKYFITTKNGTVALDALVRKSKVWNDKIGEDYALDPSEKAEFDNVMESIKEIYMTEGLGAQDNGYMR
ncbi:MAG: hypothetical protein J6U96_01635, partial [Elusimicrobiaceae bacterium]|nr:hypothetical protein [Elusimicrobiaceae bacterium]